MNQQPLGHHGALSPPPPPPPPLRLSSPSMAAVLGCSPPSVVPPRVLEPSFIGPGFVSPMTDPLPTRLMHHLHQQHHQQHMELLHQYAVGLLGSPCQPPAAAFALPPAFHLPVPSLVLPQQQNHQPLRQQPHHHQPQTQPHHYQQQQQQQSSLHHQYNPAPPPGLPSHQLQQAHAHAHAHAHALSNAHTSQPRHAAHPYLPSAPRSSLPHHQHHQSNTTPPPTIDPASIGTGSERLYRPRLCEPVPFDPTLEHHHHQPVRHRGPCRTHRQHTSSPQPALMHGEHAPLSTSTTTTTAAAASQSSNDLALSNVAGRYCAPAVSPPPPPSPLPRPNSPIDLAAAASIVSNIASAIDPRASALAHFHEQVLHLHNHAHFRNLEETHEQLVREVILTHFGGQNEPIPAIMHHHFHHHHHHHLPVLDSSSEIDGQPFVSSMTMIQVPAPIDLQYEALAQLEPVPKGASASTIASLPTSLYSSATVKAQGDSVAITRCNICLDDYSDGDELKTLSACTHNFHSECLVKWLSINKTCPVCRAEVVPSSSTTTTTTNNNGVTVV